MRYDAAKQHRRSIRLKGYDYSRAGSYFITIVTQDRASLFGDVVDDAMRLCDAGKMIHAEWQDLPNRFRAAELDAFVVMPNHIHGILVIAADSRNDAAEGSTGGDPVQVVPTVGTMVGAFKSLTTVLFARGVRTNGWLGFRERLWQRNYHEHIIRDAESLESLRQYIFENPARWGADRENPLAIEGAAIQHPAS